ncbi:MAG: PilW family protein [Pseudomonadales bacterium]|nr:PilW family protein [Pseudomonadales bacterium]
MLNRQKGLSLVELMVALAIGLLITAAVVQLFITNRQTFNLQQGVASVLEQGQFAVDFLSREMMSAGYGNVPNAFVLGAPIDGGQSTDGNRYDSVRIMLDSGDDCAGGELDEDHVPEPWKHYSVVVQDDGNGILMCQDSDGNNNPLIDNVEAFQVLYGIGVPGSVTPNYYASATTVNSSNIVSVRLGILIASNGVASHAGLGEGAITVLDRTYDFADESDGAIAFDDGRIRRLFVSTVAMRNLAGE